MTKRIRIAIVFILLAFNSSGQNIFDTTRKAEKYYGDTTPYVQTKFEKFISQQVEKNLKHSSKIILVSLPTGMIPEYGDTCTIFQKYILVSYEPENGWVANTYAKASCSNNDDTFLRYSPVKIIENKQLRDMREQWDSLNTDWYLPFIQETTYKGVKGYFPSEASDMGFMTLYAIDKTQTVYKQIYAGDLEEEWSFPGMCIKNVNFAYNNIQPTFSVMNYLKKWAESQINN